MRLIRGLAMIAVAVGLMAGAPSPGDDAKAYLDRALDILQREHVNSAQADWPALRAQAERAAATATTPSQTYGAIRETIRVLGERHTQLFAPAPPHPPSPAVAPIRALPEGRLVGEHVAVLTLPSLMRDLTNPADDGRSYRNAARDFIASTRAKPICGWILDLRGHSGGDMWPGLLGLGDLLGPGSHGAFVGPQGRDAWPSLPAPAPIDAPVAVLIGPRTGSSGEMIAIAFEGRLKTRFFGAPSAGLTSANRPFILSDGAILTVTTALVEDRNGHRYEGSMVPDQTTPVDAAEPAATAWLASQGCAS